MMIEIRKNFASFDDFEMWKKNNSELIPSWTQSIVRDVRRHGIFEPITNRYFPGRDITIDQSRLIVSLEADGLNARKRVGLLALLASAQSYEGINYRHLKILSAEAITRPAEIFKSFFPYYLGTEFLPTDQEKREKYPVQHLDLMNPGIEPESFDLFFSAHVLEHVPTVRSAIAEIAKILKPGGILVSTYPFKHDRKTEVTKAILNANGEIEHLMEPEYHGNPVRPEEGSLVFQLPGWDILDHCRDAGLSQANLTYFASSRHGITSNDIGGLFALIARKPTNDDRDKLNVPRQIDYKGAYF